MPFDDDGEETKIFRIPGETICSHGRGSSLIRVIRDSGESFVMNKKKEILGPVSQFLPSHCGVHFDEYVQRALPEQAFPYSSVGPASRTLETLWAGRRLRILLAPESIWYEGKVAKWVQWCSGPYSPSTLWYLRIDFIDTRDADGATDDEAFKARDLVEIQGLKSAAQYNGKLATVQGFDDTAGRFQVYHDKKTLLVKAENLHRVQQLTREVGRVNIDGGGTLIGQDEDTAPILSFEWIDAVEPLVDISLPEPFLEDDEFHAPENMETSSLDLESKRSIYLSEFADRMPSIVGPPDCSPDGSFIQTPRRQAYDASSNEFRQRLVRESETDLLTFRSTLMEYPLLLWNHENMRSLADDDGLSIEALKVIVEVLRRRFATGCFQKMEIWLWEHFHVLPDGCATINEAIETYDFVKHFAKWTCNYTRTIGWRYENAGQFRKAVPWYQKAVGLSCVGYDSAPGATSTYCHDLGTAYEKAGFLNKALGCYDHGISKGVETSPIIRAHERLLNELTKWTGTSGYMVLGYGSERLREGKTWKSLKLSQPESLPAYYGGVRKEDCNELPTDTLYGSLTRTVSPPPLHRWSESQISDDVKVAYMDIFSGNCTLEWIEKEDELDLTVIGDLETAGRFRGPLMKLNFLRDARTHETLLVYNTAKLNTSFSVGVPENQQLSLAYRVIHLFVRSHGVHIASIPASALCRYLFLKYGEKGRWKEAIDCAMIQVDISLKIGNDMIAAMAFNQLGEALEAVGRFSEAAQVYKETVERYCPSLKGDQLVRHHVNSGLAYKRAADYENAEKEYVASLHFLSRLSCDSWNLNDDLSDNIITNILVFYNEWSNEIKSTTTMYEAEMIEVIFASLLFVAGFEAQSGGLSAHLVKTCGPKLATNGLKSEFATKAGAKGALVSATQTQNVSEFRSSLLGCVHSIFTVETEGSRRNAKSDKDSKHHARKAIQNQSEKIGASVLTCGNKECEKSATASAQCPCGSVSFCSKECQITHWHGGHKEVCRSRKKNRKKPTDPSPEILE